MEQYATIVTFYKIKSDIPESVLTTLTDWALATDQGHASIQNHSYGDQVSRSLLVVDHVFPGSVRKLAEEAQSQFGNWLIPEQFPPQPDNQ